jgi:hypothetical protein
MDKVAPILSRDGSLTVDNVDLNPVTRSIR